MHDDRRGLTGWGEAAPLPEFGTEDADTCLRALEAAAAFFGNIADVLTDVVGGAGTADGGESARGESAPALPGVITALAHLLPELAEAPAARFAVECALLDLFSRSERVSMAYALGGQYRIRIPVNAVIGAVPAGEAAQAAAAAGSAGFDCLKIKVGSASLEEDIDRLRAVRLAVRAETRIRLDANGAWEFGDAEEALRAFAMYDIEYVEQPVPAEDVDELAALTGMNIIRIAADESAQNLEQARRLLARDAVHLFVIKPMAAGSLVDSRAFAIEAARHGRDVVFTSLIDSAIGRRAVAQLCASLPASSLHHGLATGVLFLTDTRRDIIEEGRLVLSEESGLGITPDATRGSEAE